MIRVSPSQVAKFRDCKRAWAFRYIDGIPDIADSSKDFGINGHARIEEWLETGKHPGDDVTGQLIQKAIKPGFLPSPDPRLLIEQEIQMGMLNGHALMLGYADLILPPTESMIPILIDHKFTSDSRYALKASELAVDAQRIIYGRYIIERFNAEQTMARWIYYEARWKDRAANERKLGRVQKVEHILTREDACGDGWLRIADDVEQMLITKQTAKTAMEVEPTGAGISCDKYRGCPYREKCGLTQAQMLTARMRQFDRAHKKDLHDAGDLVQISREGKNTMGLKEKLQTGYDEATEKATLSSTPAISALDRIRASRTGSTINPPAPEPMPDLAIETTSASEPSSPSPTATSEVAVAATVADKPKRGRPPKEKVKEEPKPEELPAAEPRAAYREFVVVIDAAYMKLGDGDCYYQLEELLAPHIKRVCEEQKVAHPGLVPYKAGWYGVEAYLDQALAKSRPDGILLVNSRNDYYAAVAQVLSKYADVVIKGV